MEAGMLGLWELVVVAEDIELDVEVDGSMR